MSTNRGKPFEESFKQNGKACFENPFLLRLYDITNGFNNISYPCDFITFEQGHLFLIECKSHDGASIPLDAIPQYERLLKYKGHDHVHGGILVGLKQKDVIFGIPIEEAEELVNAGEKSFGIRHLKQGHFLDLKGNKKRVFMICDYQKVVDFYKKK